MNYRIIVVVLCVFDAVIATVGVERLVTFAAPLLSLIYPPILVIVGLSFIRKHIGKLSARFTVYFAFLCGAYDMVAGFGYRIRALDSMPLSNIGLAWVLPCLLVFVSVFTVEKIQAKNRSV